MHLTYEKRENGFSVEWKESVHVPPHLHEAIEIIYVIRRLPTSTVASLP